MSPDVLEAIPADYLAHFQRVSQTAKPSMRKQYNTEEDAKLLMISRPYEGDAPGSVDLKADEEAADMANESDTVDLTTADIQDEPGLGGDGMCMTSLYVSTYLFL